MYSKAMEMPKAHVELTEEEMSREGGANSENCYNAVLKDDKDTYDPGDSNDKPTVNGQILSEVNGADVTIPATLIFSTGISKKW